MNPENDLAVKGPAIVNGNLFAFSWVSFILCWVLLKLIVEQVHVMEQARSGNLTYMTPAGRKGYPPLIPITPNRLALIGLMLFSLVVLVASVRAYKQQLCSEWNRQLCKRIIFSMCVSVMTVIGFMMAYFYRFCSAYTTGHIPHPKWRLVAKGFLLLGWFLAAGMGTFGKHAPSHSMGNFYMGLWICFGLSLYLFKRTLVEYFVATGRPESKHRTQRSPRIPGLMQPQDSYDEAPDDDGRCISLTTTDGTSEDVTAHSTPAITTPVVCGNIKDRSLSHEISSRYSVAVSLEESFGNGASPNDRGITKRKSEDPEEGLITILQKASSTEKTVDTRSSDENDASAQTSRRSSATSSSDLSSRHKSPGNGTRTRITSGDKGDCYHEPVKQMSVPFGSSDSASVEDYIFDDAETSFENHALSCSAITTAVDNTTGDVLIDPRDFKHGSFGKSR
jgi:hypothetical protein